MAAVGLVLYAFGVILFMLGLSAYKEPECKPDMVIAALSIVLLFLVLGFIFTGTPDPDLAP